MVKCKYFLKRGKICYLSPFGDIKSKEEKMVQKLWHLGTGGRGGLAKQASEFKAQHEYECATNASFCSGTEKY